MAPASSLGVGACAVAFLVVREVQQIWQSFTGASGVQEAPAALISATTTPVPAAAGFLEQARTALYYLFLGALLGAGVAGWAWWRFGSRSTGQSVHLAVDTSVVVQHAEQPEAQSSRRRRGHGVLEGPTAGATRPRLVQ